MSQSNLFSIYNLTEGGEGIRASYVRPPHSEETKRRISEALTGRRLSAAHKANLSGAKSTQEAKQHMKQLMTGNTHAIGYHHSTDAKNRIAAAVRQRVISVDTRSRMSESAKARRGGV